MFCIWIHSSFLVPRSRTSTVPGVMLQATLRPLPDGRTPLITFTGGIAPGVYVYDALAPAQSSCTHCWPGGFCGSTPSLGSTYTTVPGWPGTELIRLGAIT